jgi:hypothetical protein
MGRTSLDGAELLSDCAIYQGLEVAGALGPGRGAGPPVTVRHPIPRNELDELMPIYQGLCQVLTDIPIPMLVSASTPVP